jgi:AcrR family transcriptional regulator
MSAHVSPGQVRNELLAAAQRCLSRHGFAGTTARMVAEEAGTSPAAINEHYGALDELLITALSMNFRTWLEPLLHAFTDAGSDPHARLERGLGLFASELPRHTGLVSAWLEAVGRGQRDPDLRERLATNQNGFRGALTQLLVDAGADRPEELARAIMTASDGILVQHVLHGSAPTHQQLGADLHEALTPR